MNTYAVSVKYRSRNVTGWETIKTEATSEREAVKYVLGLAPPSISRIKVKEVRV